MPRHPGYRFASEWQLPDRPAGNGKTRFLRTGRTHDQTLVAGLFHTENDDEHIERPEEVLARATEFPETRTAPNAPMDRRVLRLPPMQEDESRKMQHGTSSDNGDTWGSALEITMEELLLVTAYQRLDFERNPTVDIYVPAALKPWHRRGRQAEVQYTMAASEAGARMGAAIRAQLLVLTDGTAKFTRQ